MFATIRCAQRICVPVMSRARVHRFASTVSAPSGSKPLSPVFLCDLERDTLGRTLLHRAVDTRNMDLIRTAVEYGFAVHELDNNGSSALHLAVLKGDVEVTSMLASAIGADVNHSDCNGMAALHHACAHGNVEIAKVLRDAGALLNAVDRQGMTPLHHAARCGQLDTVVFLVESGANATVKDVLDKTPLDLARHYDRPDIVRYLHVTGCCCL